MTDSIESNQSEAIEPSSIESNSIEPKSSSQCVKEIDLLLSHVWMVRTFLKHSEEAEEDDELQEVHRTLYDYMLALGVHSKTATMRNI